MPRNHGEKENGYESKTYVIPRHGGTLTLRGLSGGSISASGKYARAGGVAGDNNGEIIEQG